jgi:hypothetical protein
MVESLMNMARESRQQGWWHAFGDVPYSVYIGLEMEAASLRTYESLIVPGLLQTRTYAEAVIFGMGPEATPAEIQKRVDVRLKRQERVTDPELPLRLWVVVDESALRREVGGSQVMYEQLEHLADMSTLPHITVQVLPHDVGAHPGMYGAFAVLEFEDSADSSVVYLEGVTSDLYLEKHTDVQKYAMMYEHLRAQALNPEKSREFVLDVAKEYAP